MHHPTPDPLPYACHQALERDTATGATTTYRDQDWTMPLSEELCEQLTMQHSTKQLTALCVLHFLRPKDIKIIIQNYSEAFTLL